MEAVTYLVKRAGITLEDNTNYQQSPAWAERELVRRLHQAPRFRFRTRYPTIWRRA